MLQRASLGKSVTFALIILAEIMAVAQKDQASETGINEIKKNLSRVEQMRSRSDYEQGLALAQESLRRAEELGEDHLITESLFQLSLIHFFLESLEEARVFMEIGLTHARLHDLKNMEGDFLNAQGVLEWKQGNLFEATAKLQEALLIKEEAEQWVSMASISNNLGIIAHSLKKYHEAVSYYQDGLDWLAEKQNNRMRASLHSNMGESLVALGEFEEAEFHLNKSLEIELKENSPLNRAYTYFNLGKLRAGQGRSENAIELYKRALEIQLNVENNWAAALTRLNLSREFITIGNLPGAVDILKAGYEDVKELNALPLLRDYSEQFSTLYEKSGKPGQAQYYSDLHQWFEDRLNSVDLGTKMSSLSDTENLQEIFPEQPSPDFSKIRIAILSLLAVLILFLAVENIRLRKETMGK